jgi:hypothetical protein
MKTLCTTSPAAASGAIARLEAMHARHYGAQKPTMLLRFAHGRRLDTMVVLDACRSTGLGEAVLVDLGDDFVVLATGPDSRAGIEVAASAFERELARRTTVPRGIGLAHNIRPGGLDVQLPLQTLLEVAREGAVVADLGGGGRVCHTELYELFGPPADAPPPVPSRVVPPAPATRASGPAHVDEARFEEPQHAADSPALHESEAGESKLDRRLHKVLGELERARARIAELEHLAAIDTGLESIHREVQGLDGTAPDYDRRLGIMTSILRANLDLRNAPTAPALN